MNPVGVKRAIARTATLKSTPRNPFARPASGICPKSIDGTINGPEMAYLVIPAQAGVQYFPQLPDPPTRKRVGG
jgi:hypothetical protein